MQDNLALIKTLDQKTIKELKEKIVQEDPKKAFLFLFVLKIKK
jgi:hypothetical protein